MGTVVKTDRFRTMLRHDREAAAMSLSELAGRIDVSVSMLCDVEKGRRNLAMEKVVAAAIELHEDVSAYVSAALEAAYDELKGVQVVLTQAPANRDGQRVLNALFVGPSLPEQQLVGGVG